MATDTTTPAPAVTPAPTPTPTPAPAPSLPVISAKINTTNPPVAAYDRYWLGIQSLPVDLNAPISVLITLRKYGVGSDGKNYYDPTAQPVIFRVHDLGKEMLANPLVAQAFGGVIEAAQSMAHVRDLL